jgi:signal transduction histidine kinase
MSARERIAEGDDDIPVEVADDGRGMAEAASLGYDLIGIQERVR